VSKKQRILAVSEAIASFVRLGLKIPDGVDPELLPHIWEHVLQDLEPDQIRAATMAFLRDPKACRWWPQPGALLGYVQAPADDFALRWAEVRGYVQSPDVALALLYTGKPPPPPWEGKPWGDAMKAAVAAAGGLRGLLNVSAGHWFELEASARQAYTARKVIAGVEGPRMIAGPIGQKR
jgi:hypothetical protein